MATKPPKPSIQQRGQDMICPECGGPVVRQHARGKVPVYCSKEHKIAHQNRRTVRGAGLSALAQAWRIDRGSGEIAKQAFAQMVGMLDQFNAEDAAAGRPKADLFAAKLLADGTMFFDRQRR